MFNAVVVLNTASVGTTTHLQLPVEGSSAAPAPDLMWGRGDVRSPGLLQATYLPGDRDRT